MGIRGRPHPHFLRFALVRLGQFPCVTIMDTDSTDQIGAEVSIESENINPLAHRLRR